MTVQLNALPLGLGVKQLSTIENCRRMAEGSRKARVQLITFPFRVGEKQPVKKVRKEKVKRKARTGTAAEAPRTEVNVGVTTCPRDWRSHAGLSLAQPTELKKVGSLS